MKCHYGSKVNKQLVPLGGFWGKTGQVDYAY
jgi:hypothetical protein